MIGSGSGVDCDPTPLIVWPDVIDRLVAGAKGRTVIEQGYRRAWELLQPQVGTITALATALQDEEELPGNRVYELLDSQNR